MGCLAALFHARGGQGVPDQRLSVVQRVSGVSRLKSEVASFPEDGRSSRREGACAAQYV